MKYSLAEKIHIQVNNSVTYMDDMLHYGVPEYWHEARPHEYEDCDGYALTKRGLLMQAGVNVSELVLVCCQMPDGQGHLVLAVDTDKGWWVLDNNYPYPMKPSDLKYKWLCAMKGGKWFEFSF